ncbi:MAG: hypothetical protein KAS32_09165 [Candidatus Peribacteraceae bacterium]|nr:hypothetical protein [Candidatus Peribacteraceae bacterium]
MQDPNLVEKSVDLLLGLLQFNPSGEFSVTVESKRGHVTHRARVNAEMCGDNIHIKNIEISAGGS